MQLENAAIVVVDRFGKGAFEEVTGHVPAEKPNENRSFPHSDDHISKLLKHIEQQETFNQELSFQARNISIASHSSYTKFQKVFFIEFPVHATSVPSNITPKRASVDTIEHWMIYKEHPEVGAIVHVHAWMDGIKATEINYPCGTIELAKTVAELVRISKEPSKAIIGLKNHGLTITGADLDDIFERIEGKIIPQVPMS